MVKIKNFIGTNDNIEVIEEKGIFTVIKHFQDLSVTPHTAKTAYYMAQMNCSPKQVVVNLKNNAIRLKPGAMQFMLGNINSNTGVKSVGDMVGKFLASKATGDAPIKPVYQGSGIVMTEPTYMHPIIEDVAEWGGIVCDDGMFICCDDEVKDEVIMRSNVSSAVAGGEGLFNLLLRGNGHAVLNSYCPREELYEIILDNDAVKIDGNMAVCWSASLQLTVERSGRSLVGSMASGEGLVNVYRGTGKILMRPM